MTETLHCPNCGMGFTLREDYLEHMRCYLPGIPPYKSPNRDKECGHCKGLGKVQYYHGDFDTCPTCHGAGYV